MSAAAASMNEISAHLTMRLSRGAACTADRARIEVHSKSTHKECSMLILTRRVGEVIKIGEEISVTVLEVKGNQVRMGFSAPKDVAVHREEVFVRIKAEQPFNPVR